MALTQTQIDYARYLLQQMFNESQQTWADVVRYGISTPEPEQDTDDYTDDYVYDSDIEDDMPDEPNDWDPGNLLPPDEEW
tara:strand:- start:365 stop:604 length:240 start_codon:yes stop_codon:yes gene_type:complete